MGARNLTDLRERGIRVNAGVLRAGDRGGLVTGVTARPAAALGRSWLRSLPAGARVLDRRVDAFVVAALEPDHLAARVPGRRGRRLVDLALVPVADRPLLRVGARFWLVTERVALPGARRAEYFSAVRVQRPGASPESLFLPNPSSPKGAA